VQEISLNENKPGYGLRVQVVPGGCAGFSYQLSFEAAGTNEDHVIEMHGVKVIVDNATMDMIKGSVVEYQDGLEGSGFKIVNPNEESGCGCGKSFS